MKTWKQTAGIFLLSLFFTSCFEITEEFTLSESGAGMYAMNMDMYKMIAMLSSLDDSTKSGNPKNMDQVRDTVIYFREGVRQSATLSAKEKLLLEEGRMKMRIDLEQKELYFRFIIPYSKSDDLGAIYRLLPKAMAHLDFEGPGDSTSTGEGAVGAKPSAEMAAANPYFTIRTGKGFFEKKLDRDEWRNHVAKDTSLTQAAMLFGGTFMTTVVHLPSPVKTCNHSFAVISPDKRTVTLKFSLADYMERPEVLDFRIEY